MTSINGDYVELLDEEKATLVAIPDEVSVELQDVVWFVPGPTGSAGVVWTGTWNAATAYLVRDGVFYNGASYRRLVAGTTAGAPDVDTTNWALIAAQGTIPDRLGATSKVVTNWNLATENGFYFGQAAINGPLPGVDEVQTVTINGAPTGGTFTLTYDGQTTAAIAFNATAATVQTALQALSTIGAGNATVTGAAGGPYTVTFVNALGQRDLTQQLTAVSSLTGGTTPSVTVATTTQGVSPESLIGLVEVQDGMLRTQTVAKFLSTAAGGSQRWRRSSDSAGVWGAWDRLWETQTDLDVRYAGLDGSGKIPAGQLPSYVDDVLEFANLAAFPATGETGKIYVALDNGKQYRWSGSAYIEVSPSEVNSVAGKTGVVTLLPADVGAHPAETVISEAMVPARLPWSISAQQTTNLDTIDTTGWVWCNGSGTTGAPETTASWRVFTERYSATLAEQWAYGPGTGRSWRRAKSTTWGAWVRTYETETELDARYINTTEAGSASGVATLDTDGNITPNQLPDRLFNQGLNVTDYNVAIEAGWVKNASASALNAPNGSTGFFYGIVTRSGGRVLQSLWEITNSSADTKKWQRMSTDSGVTWGAWYRLREAEAELDARYVIQGGGVFIDRGAITAVTDFNTLTSQGSYKIVAASTWANFPTGAHQWGQLVVLKGETSITQVYYPDLAGLATPFHRISYDGVTWKAWARSAPSIEWDGATAGSQWIKKRDNVVLINQPNTTDGELIIQTNLDPAQSRMVHLHVKGASHLAGKEFVDVDIRFYVAAGATPTVAAASDFGSCPIDSVRVFKRTSDNKLAVVITANAMNLDWFKGSADVSIGHGVLAPDSELEGWTATISTDLTALTLLGTITPKRMFQDDSGWIVLTLQNLWVNFGAGHAEAAYRKVGNRVTVKGFVKSGTATAGTILFNLPIGYRPTGHLHIPQVSTSAFAAIGVGSDGNVTILAGNNTNLSINCSFLVD